MKKMGIIINNNKKNLYRFKGLSWITTKNELNFCTYSVKNKKFDHLLTPEGNISYQPIRKGDLLLAVEENKNYNFLIHLKTGKIISMGNEYAEIVAVK